MFNIFQGNASKRNFAVRMNSTLHRSNIIAYKNEDDRDMFRTPTFGKGNNVGKIGETILQNVSYRSTRNQDFYRTQLRMHPMDPTG